MLLPKISAKAPLTDFFNTSKSLTPAVLHFIPFVQKAFTTSFCVTFSKNNSVKAFVNTNYTKNKSAKNFRRCVEFYTTVLLVMISLRMFWLTNSVNRKQAPSNVRQQLILCIMVNCAIVFGLLLHSILYRCRHEICYLINQSFQMVPLQQGLSAKALTFGNAIVYSLVICILCFPLFGLVYPFAVNFHVLQIALEFFYPQMQGHTPFYVKLSFGISYAIPSVYLGAEMFFGIGIILMIMDRGLEYCDKLCCWKNFIPFANSYSVKLQQFRLIQMGVFLCNIIIHKSLLTILILSIAYSSTSTYIVVEMHDKLPVAVVLAFPVGIFICIVFDVVMFCLCDVVYSSGETFRQRWKWSIKGNIYLAYRQILSCPKIGLSIGPIRFAKQYTVLVVANVRIDVTANMLMVS